MSPVRNQSFYTGKTMSLRLIEIIVPIQNSEELSHLLQEENVIGLWTAELREERMITRILVPMEKTEQVTDLVIHRFGSITGFRLMLFAVEATLPQLEEMVEQAAEEPLDEETSEAVLERISREELYQDITQGARFTNIYLITVILSTVVAAVGLIRDSVAVIIGAMVIAPLLGPNVGLALATTLGDLKLGIQALKALLGGVIAAFMLSFLIGWMLDVDPSAPEILTRTQFYAGDIVLALAAGSAGALAVTTGIPAALIGVMVAVALLPPLVTTGLLAGAGYYTLAGNALLLFTTNIIGLNLAGVVTFLIQKVRPRTHGETQTAKEATWTAILIWLLLIGILLTLIFVFGQE
jgi:uncharacterized hydrophobic protein (TIGR00341 family)